jgi:predicted ABC-type ATPase
VPNAPPLLWLIVGSNGAGKSTYYERVIHPHLKAPFVNADLIARSRWPRAYVEHAYDAGRIAEHAREALIRSRVSFVAETVFSHPSKLDLIRQAKKAEYLVWLSFIGSVFLPGDFAMFRTPARFKHKAPRPQA